MSKRIPEALAIVVRRARGAGFDVHVVEWLPRLARPACQVGGVLFVEACSPVEQITDRVAAILRNAR